MKLAPLLHQILKLRIRMHVVGKAQCEDEVRYRADSACLDQEAPSSRQAGKF